MVNILLYYCHFPSLLSVCWRLIWHCPGTKVQ